MGVTFHIISSEGLDAFPMEDIKKDYIGNQMLVSDIKKKYGISHTKWNIIRKYFQKENLPIRSRGRSNIGAKYYYYDGSRYRIRKTIKGQHVYFGSFDTEEEAQCRVEELKSNNWNGLV